MAASVETRLVSQVYVKIDGFPLMGRVIDDLTEARVESTVHLPDLATLRFNNPELEWSDGEKFKVGQEIEVEFGDSRLKRQVFSGEVTALGLEVGEEGALNLVVRAYDRAHRLHRGRFTRTFLQMKDSDIARKIARELSLDTDQIEDTPQVHQYLLQHNQTNWEFLQERASFLGFELQVNEKKLVFKPPPSTPSESLSLAWRDELLSFHANMTAGEQVNEVEVRGWDPREKKAVSGIAKRPELLPSIGVRQSGGELAASAFHSDARVVVAREPVYSQEQAKKLAQTVLEDLSSVFVTAEGVAMGDPRLRLGSKVEVKSVGSQFSGEYVVTQARHVYSSSGYNIEFEVTGRRSTDLVSLFSSPARGPAGPYVLQGIVSNTKDPDDLGRVKVKFPTLSSEPESFWCRVVSPGAGPQRGLQLLPEIEDEVLAFGNDINNLFVLGGLWNGVDKPPLKSNDAISGGAVVKRVLRSRTGHQILIEDPADSKASGGGITIVDSTGKNKIIINTKTNSLEATVTGDIKIQAGGSITLSADKAIKLDAGTSLDLEAGSDASLEAGSRLELSGAVGANLKSNASVGVAAPQVSLGQ
jgi:phage protein D